MAPRKNFRIPEELILFASGLFVILLTIADWIHIYPVLLRSVGYEYVGTWQALSDKPDVLMIMLSVHGAMIFFALRGKTVWVVTIALILVAFNLQFWWMDIAPDGSDSYGPWDWIMAGWPGLVMTALHIFLLAFFSDVFLQYREDHDQRRGLASQVDRQRKELIKLRQVLEPQSKELESARAQLKQLAGLEAKAQLFEQLLLAEIRKRKYDQLKKESHRRQLLRLSEQIEKGGLSEAELVEKRFEQLLRERVMGEENPLSP